MKMQEHIRSGQGTFGVCSGLVKGMEVYIPLVFITSYYHVGKWG